MIAYPEKYEDKFIKVVGKYRSGSAIWTITSEFGEYKINISGTIQGASASFGLTRAYLDFSIVNETNDTALIVNNEYYWYGTFRYTNHVRSSNGENYARGMYLEVSKIEEL